MEHVYFPYGIFFLLFCPWLFMFVSRIPVTFNAGVSFLLVTSKTAQHKAGGISGSVSLNGEAV